MTFPADFSAQAWATAMLRANSSYTEATYAFANTWRNGVRQAVEGAAARRKAIGQGTRHDPAWQEGLHTWQTLHRQAEHWAVQSADNAACGAVAMADNAAQLTRQSVQAALTNAGIAQDPLARALIATHSAFQLAWAQVLARHAEDTLRSARRLEASVTHDAQVVDIFEKPAR